MPRTKQLKFLREFIQSPKTVGALAPSSARLARRMARGLDLSSARTLIELGPGTGALTATFLDEKSEGSRFIGVEQNESFVRVLQREFPGGEFVLGSAQDLPEMLEERGVPHADVVLSGLPWATFEEALQKEILSAVLQVLREGGTFTTFAYALASQLPRARRFRRLLHESFASVSTTPIVWRNFPPAFAYQCVR